MTNLHATHDDPVADNGETGKRQKPPHDPDARASSKTHKSGRKERFYGYHEHTVVSVPHRDQDPAAQPRVIVRAELTGATEDVVEPTLSLLDRIPTDAMPDRRVEEVIVDRHYSYKGSDRWKRPLTERGIEQVLDLRADEQGFIDIDGVLWAAGWPHCPATPRHLGTITAPEPGNNDPTVHAEFFELIDERRLYAFERHTLPDANGKARWVCPAAAGKIGCPNQPGTVETAVEIGQRVVEDQPEPTDADFPTCCRQKITTLTPTAKVWKLMQRFYWGSHEWRQEYNKRTYVESTYGIRKNGSCEDLRRGAIRTTGLPLTNIMYAVAAASYNLRALRKWHADTGLGDPNHPLLEERPESFGFEWSTAEERDATDQRHQPMQDAEAQRSTAVPPDGPGPVPVRSTGV